MHRRLRSSRYLHDRSDCYRLERQLPGGALSHREIAPFHGAHTVELMGRRQLTSDTIGFPSAVILVRQPVVAPMDRIESQPDAGIEFDARRVIRAHRPAPPRIVVEASS